MSAAVDTCFVSRDANGEEYDHAKKGESQCGETRRAEVCYGIEGAESDHTGETGGQKGASQTVAVYTH